MRGQSTIELLLILSMLFIILGLALNIFSNQRTFVNEKQVEFEAYRTAKKVEANLIQVAAGPIGGRQRVFIPPSIVSQTISVGNGHVDVSSGNVRVIIPVASRSWFGSVFYDGNWVTLFRDANAVRIQAGG